MRHLSDTGHRVPRMLGRRQARKDERTLSAKYTHLLKNAGKT